MFSTLIINTCSVFFFFFWPCQLHFSQTVKKVKKTKQNKKPSLCECKSSWRSNLLQEALIVLMFTTE